MVTSMMVNFFLMCVTLLTIPKINPQLASNISVIKKETTSSYWSCGRSSSKSFFDNSYLQRSNIGCCKLVF